MKFLMALTCIVIHVSLPAKSDPALGSGNLPATTTETAAEALIAKTEVKAIEALKAIIQHRDEPDLYYRLAELYMRQGKSGRYFESLHSGVKMDVNVPGIKEALKNALATYIKIEKTWPDFKDLDGVTFNHGLACLQDGQINCAKERMMNLLRAFPQSKFASDANLTLAEIQYDSHDFAGALKYYAKVPEGRTYSYAQYKSAWSNYNLKDTSKAIRLMKSVVRVPRNGETNLTTEALRDLALFLESDSQPHKYLLFFKEVCGSVCGSQEISETLITLGNLLSSHDKLKELESLASELSVQSSYRSTRVKLVLILAANLDKQPLKHNLHERVVSSLKEGFTLCHDKPSTDTKLEPQAESCLELVNLTKDLAKKWTEENKFPRWTLQALDILIKYESTPDEHLHQARAELLFQLNEFKNAEVEYTSTAHRLCPIANASLNAKLDSKASAQAAPVSVLSSGRSEICEKMAYGSLVSADRSGLKNSMIIERALFYVDLPESMTKQSQRDEAILTLGIRHHQEKDDRSSEKWLMLEQKSEVAQDLLLKIMTDQKRYEDLKNFSAKFATMTHEESRKKNLLDVSEQAHYQIVQSKKDTDLILEFSMLHEPSKLAESALWQVISLRQQSKYLLAGGDLCLYLSHRYPQSSHAKECQDIAMQDYQMAGDQISATALEKKLADQGVEPYVSQRKLTILEKDLENKNYTDVYNEATRITKVSSFADVRARAQLLRARVFEHELVQQSTKTSLQRLPMVLSIKAEKLEKTQTTFTSVLKMTNSPVLKKEAVEGLLRSLENFVMDLKEPRLTDEVPADQLKVLRTQLAEVRSPAEQRIVELQQQLKEFTP